MRVLVVGGGSIGRRHLANLLALGVGEAEVCDTDPATVEALQRSLGIHGSGSLEEALHHRPDLVLVCTPAHQHVTVALEALKTGAHLFIEKPLAVSLEGVEELIECANRQGRVVLTACNMRFHPGVATLKASVDGGTMKQPCLFRACFSHYLPYWRPGENYRHSYSAHREQGGGVILECIHELDYLQWMAGKVTDLQAVAGHASQLEINVEDIAILMMQFETGAIGEARLDFLSPVKLRGCQIIGAEGLLRWRSEGKAPERVIVEHAEDPQANWKTLYRNEAYDANEMYLKELRHLLDCVEGKAAPFVGLKEARDVLRLALNARATALPYPTVFLPQVEV